MQEENKAITDNIPGKNTKKTINRVQLNESTLLQPNKGLKRLYQITQLFKPSGNPKSDLRALLNLYEEWHFLVAPKFEFNYFVQKCQTLGVKAPIRGYMNRLREFHSGKITEQEFDNPLSNLEEPLRDIEEDQVYESPKKLLNLEDDEENFIVDGNKDVVSKRSPEVNDFFEFVDGDNEEEQDMNEDELEYLQELALDSGKRVSEVDGDEEYKKIKESYV